MEYPTGIGSETLGGPMAADNYKRAVYRAPPSRFYVDMLPPLKQGGSFSYGFRVTPANTEDEGSLSSFSSRDTQQDVVYDIWRRWEDCLWFQEMLEQTYSRLAREKHRRLTAGKGIKKNGMYLQDQASSWESLPPGPDPNSVAKNFHDVVPKLTKKGTLFRASQATIDQRYAELTALIEALFDFDVPALIRELRADRNVTDFFGYWRKDLDAFNKQQSRLGKTKSSPTKSPRQSTDSVNYTLSAPSINITMRSDVASLSPSRGRGSSVSPCPSSPGPYMPSLTSSRRRKSHSRARSTASSGSSSSQESRLSEISTPSTSGGNTISTVFDNDRRSQYLSDYSFNETASLETVQESGEYRAISDRYSQFLMTPEKESTVDRRSRRTVTIYSPSTTDLSESASIDTARVRDSWQTTSTVSGMLDELSMAGPYDEGYDSPLSRRNSTSSVETFMTNRTAAANSILNGLESTFQMSPSRNPARDSVVTFMTTDSADAIVPRGDATFKPGQRPRDSVASFATFKSTNSAMSGASEDDDCLGSYLDQFPLTLGSCTDAPESRPSTPLGRLSMLPLAKSLSNDSVVPPVPTLRISTGRARSSSTSASILSSSSSSSGSTNSSGMRTSGHITVKAAFGNSIILLRLPRGVGFTELRDKILQKFAQQEKIQLSDEFIIGYVPRAPGSPTSPSPQPPVKAGGRARSSSLSSELSMSSAASRASTTSTSTPKRGPVELVTSQREWEYVTVIAAGEKLMLKIFDCQAL